jgi:hypothetical protein
MGQTPLLSLRRKSCWGFFRPKNPTASAGFEPANLGTKGQNATSRPPKPLVSILRFLIRMGTNRNLTKYQASTAVGLSFWVFVECGATSVVIFGQPAPKRRFQTAYWRYITFQEFDDVEKVNAAGHDILTVRFGKEEFWHEFIRNANIPH